MPPDSTLLASVEVGLEKAGDLNIQLFYDYNSAESWLLLDDDESADQHKNVNEKRLVVKYKEKYTLLAPENICFLRSETKGVSIHCTDGKHYTNETLTNLYSQLPQHFLRLHRSCVVNLNHIKQLKYFEAGAYQVVLADGEGTVLPVSKKQVPLLKTLLGLDGE